MTTIDVQTAISPAAILRLYQKQAIQDMHGGGTSYGVPSRNGVVERPTGGSITGNSGFVQIPIVTDQSAAANPLNPLDLMYHQQFMKSQDDAAKARTAAEYVQFRDQWIRATLSNYK